MKREKSSLRLVLLALFAFLPLWIGAQNVRLKGDAMTLKAAFAAVERQTGLSIDYDSREVDVSKVIKVKNANGNVQKAMETILQGTGYTFEIIDKHIVIRKVGSQSRKAKEAAPAKGGAKKTIKGKVTDAAGEPIIGATVREKGVSGQGAVTDINGDFTLDAHEGAILTVSYIGYATQNVRVAPDGTCSVKMSENDLALNEVVVVGYGNSTKRDLIASVSTVNAAEMTNVPVANISQGLAGRSPGLIVTASGGGINSTPRVSIRGGGDPIYVIDGIIRSSVDFQNLSPEDIESISILKDASATAVYGSRATNGIIQVTTKQGKSGKMSVNYDFSYSLSQPSIWPKQLGSYDRAVYANKARANDGLEPIYNEAALQAFRDGSDPEHFPSTDWRGAVLKNWAPQTKHTVTFSGGGENSKYYASLGHIYQNSLYKNDNHFMKRTNARLAVEGTMPKLGLTFRGTIDGYRQHNEHPYTSTAGGYGAVFSHINDKMPYVPAVNKYGLPYNVTDNPVAETAKDAGYSRNYQNVVNGKGEIIWNCLWVDGLRLRLASNYRYYGESVKNWRKDAAQYDWDSTTPNYLDQPSLYHSSSTGYSYTNQAFVDYKQTFARLHTVTALAGFEQYYQKGDQYWLQRDKYQFPIDQIGAGNANTKDNGGSEAELGRMAWIFQLKYDYDKKYYAEFSMREDGSDYFAPGHRWGTFFSGSLGWVVTKEKFMKSLVDRNILNLLKLRASYGETGLDSSAGRFAYLTSYGLDNQGYVVDGKYVPGFYEGSLPSPDLTWYTTKQTVVGFDFATLNYRLTGSFDYFYYSTKGYLMTPVGSSYINTALGIAAPKVKSNSEHRRAGYEITLGWKDEIGQVKYWVDANFTHFDQMWALDESEARSSVLNPYQRTQQQKGYYGVLYHSLGFYQSAQDVYSSAGYLAGYNSNYLTAGDLKYEDTNGDGQITAADGRRLGKASVPRGQFGITLGLEWKGISFSTLFQGSTAFDMYIPGSAGMQTGQTKDMPVAFKYQNDYWRPDNRDAQYPRLMSNTSYNQNNNYLSSDFWLVNGAYFRMKDFQVSYDLKQTLLKSVDWLSRVRVGISGQNLFTISKSTKYGLDPENSSTAGYGYPVERSLAFTLNLGF